MPFYVSRDFEPNGSKTVFHCPCTVDVSLGKQACPAHEQPAAPNTNPAQAMRERLAQLVEQLTFNQ
ncbi:MAG: hypothetical protein KDJ48_11125, partial [Nitratireductor sp.]|nr:hypothetical protein [Nitratireductor sp.]